MRRRHELMTMIPLCKRNRLGRRLRSRPPYSESRQADLAGRVLPVPGCRLRGVLPRRLLPKRPDTLF